MPEDVINPYMEWLRGKSLGASLGSMHVELAGGVITALGREQRQFKRYHLRRLQVGGSYRSLGVAQSGVFGLGHEVHVDGLAGGVFAAIPHYRAEEAQVGRRQRPPEHGELLRSGFRTVVRVLNSSDLKFGIAGDRQRYANQAFVKKHAVGMFTRLFR